MVMCDPAQALWIAVFANWVSVWTTPACSAAALLLCERRWRFPGDSQSVHKKIERIRKKQTWTWTHTHTFLWIEGQGTLVQQPLDHRINDRRSYGPFDGRETNIWSWSADPCMVNGSLSTVRSRHPRHDLSFVVIVSEIQERTRIARYAQRRSKTNERVLGICGFETLVWGVKTARIQRDCCGMRWNSTMTAVYPFLRPDKRLKEHSTMNRWVGDYNETWPTFHSRLPRKKSMTSNDSFVSYYCTSRINGGFSVITMRGNLNVLLFPTCWGGFDVTVLSWRRCWHSVP